MKKAGIYTGLVALSLLSITGGMSAHAADTKVKDTTGTLTFTQGTVNPGALELDAAGLPTALNFGSAAIDYTGATNLKATVDGKQASAVTTGNLKVTDERGNNVGWKVKVNQASQFENAGKTKTLTGAVLSMTTGAIANVGGTAPTGGKASQKIDFTPGTAEEMFVANANEGDGISQLPISQFDLSVPGTAPKAAEAFTTPITWTLSDTI